MDVLKRHGDPLPERMTGGLRGGWALFGYGFRPFFRRRQLRQRCSFPGGRDRSRGACLLPPAGRGIFGTGTRCCSGSLRLR